MFRVLTLHADGQLKARPEGSTEAGDIAPPPDGAIRWIDLTAQDEAQMRVLAERFHFHPLAIEDCLHVDQRPKLEEYDQYLFLVSHALRCENADDPTAMEPLELHAFLGPGYLVTVHLQPIAKLEVIWQRVSADTALFKRGADFVYYMVSDGIVDSHFAHIDRISDRLEALEEAVLERAQRENLHQIFALKHTLVLMRKLLSPQRDVFAVLSRRGGDKHVTERTALYFRDVYDHLVRIYESIDAARDILGSALEAYLSMVSQRTNEIMKSLTLLSAVFLPLSFVTGFFGQNFEAMPWKSTHLLVGMLATCVAIPVIMLFWFRSRRWL